MVFLPWIFNFYEAGGLSSSPSDWADFGSYVGGTLSSLVSGLALLALLYTISQQHKQIQSLQHRASTEDILKAIDRLERDLDGVLDGINIEVSFDDGNHSISAHDVLFKPSAAVCCKAIPTEQEIKALLNENGDELKIKSLIFLYETFGLAAGAVNQIRLYSEGLKEIESKSGSNILSRYYHRKYNSAYSRLYDRGLLIHKWENES